jgi:hypothetical protein
LLIAFTGLFSSALIIAVVAQKLMLTRGEKYVHNFVLKTELANEHVAQAANIVKYTMKLWIAKQNNKAMASGQHLRYKKKLFESLHAIHRIKKAKRGLIDNCIGFPEIAILQRTTNTNTDDTIQQMGKLELKIGSVEEQLIDVKQAINSMQNTLNLLVNTVRK